MNFEHEMAFPYEMNGAQTRYSGAGMALRDYFAIRCLESIIVDADSSKKAEACKHAYEWADAMIDAR